MTNINALLLEKLQKEFELEQIDLKDNKSLKKKGMKFNLEAYNIKDVGHLFLMDMSGMLGLMKMETLVFVSNTKDIPLLNTDYIKAFGKETLLIELYDNMLNPYKQTYLDEYQKIKDLDKDLTDYVTDKAWYDPILYKETYRKTGKKLLSRFNNASEKYLDIFVKQIKELKPCDKEKKQEKVANFANTLYTNGGPAVNTFKKLFGEELAKKVVCEYMYGVK